MNKENTALKARLNPTVILSMAIMAGSLLLPAMNFAQDAKGAQDAPVPIAPKLQVQGAPEIAPAAKTKQLNPEKPVNPKPKVVIPKIAPAAAKAPVKAKAPVRAKAQAQAVVRIQPNIIVNGVAQNNFAGQGVQILNKPIVLDEFVMEEKFMKQQALLPVADPAAAEDEKKENRDVIRFLNADRLHGNITGIKDEKLELTSPISDDTLRFALDRLAEIRLADRPYKPGEHQAIVELTNGDEFKGDIIDLNDEHLVLDTWFAGELKIERLMLKSLRPNSGLIKILYEGPKEMSDFVHNGSAWSMSGNKLVVKNNGSFGKEFKEVPDKVRYDFTVTWQNYSSFSFKFFSDTATAATGGNGYTMAVRSSNYTLTRYSNEQNQRQLWQKNSGQMVRGGSTTQRFTLLADIKGNSFHLLLDDKPFHKWEDTTPEGVIKKGNSIVVYAQQYGNLSISDLKITEWDGREPQVDDADDGDEKPIPDDVDVIFFKNSDVATGSINNLKDKKRINLKTEFDDMDIPLKVISAVEFAPEEAERARRMAGDVRATFQDWGSITLELTDIVDGKLKGKSENYGEIEMPLDAFSKLEFNIYDFREKEEEDLEQLFRQ